MTARSLLGAVALGLLFLLLLPADAHAWTPGAHIYLGEAALGNLGLLPAATAELLQRYPLDFLYGSIAADTSIAKKYAPIGRHAHSWHVGQEIHDVAESERLRAFGLGYLAHLAADIVAHNYFVPRQLVLTGMAAGVGHSYWESRVDAHLGRRYSKLARDLLRLDQREADTHLNRLLAPTLFSVQTSRRLFRGMVRLTESRGWQRGVETARDWSRGALDDEDVARHMALSFDYLMAVLSGLDAEVRRHDPSGEAAIGGAKPLRRNVLAEGQVGRLFRLRSAAEGSFGVPRPHLGWFERSTIDSPWGRLEPVAPPLPAVAPTEPPPTSSAADTPASPGRTEDT